MAKKITKKQKEDGKKLNNAFQTIFKIIDSLEMEDKKKIKLQVRLQKVTGTVIKHLFNI